MKYFIVDHNKELMRKSFFIYRKNMKDNDDAIVALIEDEHSTENDILSVQKKLLLLEGEYRTKHNQWNCPPVKLETMFLPKYS